MKSVVPTLGLLTASAVAVADTGVFENDKSGQDLAAGVYTRAAVGFADMAVPQKALGATGPRRGRCVVEGARQCERRGLGRGHPCQPRA